MRQTSLPLSEVVPGIMLYANRAVNLEPVSTISHVVFCPVNHGQAESPLHPKMMQLMPGHFESIPGLPL